MTKKEAESRMKSLRAEILEHARNYYEKDTPTVSDAVYDSLVHELKSLDQKYPDLANLNFVTYRVGGEPLANFTKVTHKQRMLSLNDAFSFAELEAWQERISKLVPEKKFNYFCELKLDGLAISLIYRQGRLVQAATRGNGLVGEDVTQNIKTIASIPLILNASINIEVRGEVVMSHQTLKFLNKKYQKAGKDLLANTRNAAAGSLRQLDPNITRERRLEFFAWDCLSEIEFKYHSERHAYLRNLGFPVAEHENIADGLNEVEMTIEKIEAIRDKLVYGTDGVVVQVNDLNLQNKIGVVGKAPRYAIAYKYAPEQAITKVTDISVNVGRTGVLTPLAHFVPTLVAGSMVSKATLHNVDQIKRLDVKIGDTVIIQKAGDVIPEIVSVIKNLRTGKEKTFVMPKTCPVCGAQVETRALGIKTKSLSKGPRTSFASLGQTISQKTSSDSSVSVAYYCTNEDCPARNTRAVIHFVKVLGIDEVGPKIIERLQNEGLISDAADLFTLNEADLSGLDRMGEKSAQNIISEIKGKMNPPLDKFIASLGIFHVGEETAQDLAEYFKTFDNFWQASKTDLESIENIGPTVAEAIYQYRHKKSAQKFVAKLLNNGVQPLDLQTKVSQRLNGVTFVLTGTLPTLSRTEAKKMILENGGKVASSVSKNTNFLLVGENPGSKYEEAQKLGVRIIEESAFLKILI